MHPSINSHSQLNLNQFFGSWEKVHARFSLKVLSNINFKHDVCEVPKYVDECLISLRASTLSIGTLARKIWMSDQVKLKFEYLIFKNQK